MIKINNKFAIGCLIQWYEIEMIGEYLQSVKNSIENIDNKENITIDLYFNCDQTLEKIDESQISFGKIIEKFDIPETFIAVTSSLFLIFKKNQIPESKIINGNML